MLSRIVDAARDAWHLHRRAVLVCVGMLIALIAVAAGVAGAVRLAHGRPQASGRPPAAAVSAPSVRTSTAPAGDVADWDAIPPVIPATTTSYPAIPAAERDDPTRYARAFATQLFTRSYATDRSQLLSWAQYEDSPLRASNYPRAVWSKVLVDSLTDLTWDDALDTPVPADGLWLVLRSEQARDSVENVCVTTDPRWEQYIANGNTPPDPLATARDVSLTVLRHIVSSGHARTSRIEVSIALELGTSPRGGYGVAATNNFVSKEAG